MYVTRGENSQSRFMLKSVFISKTKWSSLKKKIHGKEDREREREKVCEPEKERRGQGKGKRKRRDGYGFRFFNVICCL